MITKKKNNKVVANVLLIGLVLTCYVLNAAETIAETYDFDEGIEILTKGLISEKWESLKGKNIAVFGIIESGSKEKWKLSSHIEDGIVDSLVKNGYRVIERRRIEDVIKRELKKQADFWFDETKIAQIGKLVGADTVFTGSYVLLGQGILKTSIRAINVADGTIFASDKVQVHTDRIGNLLEPENKNDVFGFFTNYAIWIIIVMAILIAGFFVILNRKNHSNKMTQRTEKETAQRSTLNDHYEKQKASKNSIHKDLPSSETEIKDIEKPVPKILKDREQKNKKNIQNTPALEKIPKQELNINNNVGQTKSNKGVIMEQEPKKIMYEIAKYLDELNAKKQVKYNSKHEKGYAKIQQIRSGCDVWFHHLLDDRLIIDLMISEAARRKFGDIADRAIETFKEFFNYIANVESWQHALDGRNYERYFIDVSKVPSDDLKKVMDKIREKFSYLI